jgi:hypothetical protein
VLSFGPGFGVGPAVGTGVDGAGVDEAGAVGPCFGAADTLDAVALGPADTEGDGVNPASELDGSP